MNNQENLQRINLVRPCVTEALIAPPSGKQTLKTQHRDVTRYLSRKMQSVISGSYSALDTSGLCWSVLADRVRLYIQTVVRTVSYSSRGVAGVGGGGREMDGAAHLQVNPKTSSLSYLQGQANICHGESCSLRGVRGASRQYTWPSVVEGVL